MVNVTDELPCSQGERRIAGGGLHLAAEVSHPGPAGEIERQSGGGVPSFGVGAPKIVDIGSYNPDADLKEMAIKIQTIKRDLGKYLLNNGINKKSVTHIMNHIVSVKNQGYKLDS